MNRETLAAPCSPPGEPFPSCAECRCSRLRDAMRPAFLLNTLWAALTVALASASIGAESAEGLIQQGDVFYDKLQAAEALKFYLPAEKLDTNNVRLLVRIAREYRHLMSDATEASEKLQLARTAVDYALRAVALAPNDPETQLALAISYGKMLP